MADIVYLIIGVIIGLLGGAVMVLLLPYRSLKSDYMAMQSHLADEQAKNNELQGAILNQQSIAYQSRQDLLSQQKRFETDFEQFSEQRNRLDQQLAELKTRSDRDQQLHAQEITQLRDAATRLEQEKLTLHKQLIRERVEWERQMQSLVLQNTQFEEEAQVMQRDKTLVDSRLEDQHEAWERERLALHVQINTLEDNLMIYKARANKNLSPDHARVLEQLKEEAAEELNKRQIAWEEEREALNAQLRQMRSDSRSPRDMDVFMQSSSQPWERERRELLQQLEQAQQVQQTLEDKIAARSRQAEQERSALEAEIEQLMDRLLRLQAQSALLERNAQNAATPSMVAAAPAGVETPAVPAAEDLSSVSAVTADPPVVAEVPPVSLEKND